MPWIDEGVSMAHVVRYNVNSQHILCIFMSTPRSNKLIVSQYHHIKWCSCMLDRSFGAFGGIAKSAALEQRRLLTNANAHV